MADEPRPTIGQGDVEITLLNAAGGQETLVLRPRYEAARVLSSQSGGLLAMMDRVARADIDAITQIVQLGLGYGQGVPAPKDLAERIWRTGVSDDSGGVAERCMMFLRVLMSGGRMPKPAAEGQDPNSAARG